MEVDEGFSPGTALPTFVCLLCEISKVSKGGGIQKKLGSLLVMYTFGSLGKILGTKVTCKKWVVFLMSWYILVEL